MTLCLGSTYAWSVFVTPLQALEGLSLSKTQLPFTVFYIVFPLTTMFSGILMKRIGPRACAVAGGIVFGAGWISAGFGEGCYALTIIGIGVIGGIGVGLAYVVPIATGILWFPKQQGLVTGLAVAGFGGGAALVAQISSHLMEQESISPYFVFRGCGIVFLVLVACAGFFMRVPKELPHESIAPAQTGNGKKYLFAILYLAMFSGLCAGFLVNANLKQLVAGSTASAGAAAVSLFALGNAMGRVGWGLGFDRTHGGWLIHVNLLAQAFVLSLFFMLSRSMAGFLCFAFLAGANYGGVLVLFAASVSRIWGARRVGHLYGWMMSSNIPASFAPVVAAYAYDARGSFMIPILACIGLLSVAGFVCMAFLTPAIRAHANRPAHL